MKMRNEMNEWKSIENRFEKMRKERESKKIYLWRGKDETYNNENPERKLWKEKNL